MWKATLQENGWQRTFSDKIENVLQKARMRSENNKILYMNWLRNVSEAGEVRQNREEWWSMNFAYPNGNPKAVYICEIVCILLSIYGYDTYIKKQ